MRWEVVRPYREGQRLSETEILSAVGVVGEAKVVGIAPLALGIEGFEEILRDNMTVYLRQRWLCREPR